MGSSGSMWNVAVTQRLKRAQVIVRAAMPLTM
jgi:hypothetical protein